ncbi:hypothetical protein [Eudoraea sp.]|jgi:hypothetical protein|uniref:hypothetical protein n=1 Tax=Eudoraea sp. TaxID=1979955 RepID=UPI003C73491F
MKFLFWICLIFSVHSHCQNEQIVNLSFNLSSENINESNRKIVDAEGVTFYIEGNYFRKDNLVVKEVSPNEIENKTFKNINDLIKYKNALIEKEIKKSKNSGVVSIISNQDVFKKIFIYEKATNNSILEHNVVWLEVIECE